MASLRARYRGYLATELCRSEVSFERVSELLWTGALPDEASAEKAAPECDAARLWPLLHGRGPLPKMALVLGALALTDVDRASASDAAELARARAVIALAGSRAGRATTWKNADWASRDDGAHRGARREGH